MKKLTGIEKLNQNEKDISLLNFIIKDIYDRYFSDEDLTIQSYRNRRTRFFKHLYDRSYFLIERLQKNGIIIEKNLKHCNLDIYAQDDN